MHRVGLVQLLEHPVVALVDLLVPASFGLDHDNVVPIEVKSGRKIRSHAALVLSRNLLERYGCVLYVPLYMTFCLDELTDRETGDFSFALVALEVSGI